MFSFMTAMFSCMPLVRSCTAILVTSRTFTNSSCWCSRAESLAVKFALCWCKCSRDCMRVTTAGRAAAVAVHRVQLSCNSITFLSTVCSRGMPAKSPLFLRAVCIPSMALETKLLIDSNLWGSSKPILRCSCTMTLYASLNLALASGVPIFLSISARLLSSVANLELSRMGTVLGAKLTSQVTFPSSAEPSCDTLQSLNRSNWVSSVSEIAPGPPTSLGPSGTEVPTVAPWPARLKPRKVFSSTRRSATAVLGSMPSSSSCNSGLFLALSARRSISITSTWRRAQRCSGDSMRSPPSVLVGRTTGSWAVRRLAWASILATSASKSAWRASFSKKRFSASPAFTVVVSIFWFS
mmetsp:Transcript_119942/g.311271  ORF Transcript_119942/g.311271 Transcript_119942/m.311271 type:complete len:352 (-) Transcript_119942:222-1277(-)